MSSEIKYCQNCATQFVIEPEDFAFYRKMNVPAPTWCPQCRAVRRLMFRNERCFYARTCGKCGKKIITMYRLDAAFPVYCNECWWSDSWDGTMYGSAYDFSKPFFAQFKELDCKIPRAAFLGSQNLNSPYANYVYKDKDVYLSSSVIESENIFYSWAVDKSFNSLDCYELAQSELCYECYHAERCYRSAFLVHANDCIDSRYLFDCANCKNCFLSSSLRNKQYVFENVQYSKEDYFRKIEPYVNGGWKISEEIREKFRKMISGSLHRYAHILRSVNATGDNIYNAKNVRACFDVYDMEDVAYAIRGFGVKDSMDTFGDGPASNHSYECMSTAIQGSMEKFCSHTWESVSDIEYCSYSHYVFSCFACAGLRSKQYCILNKQYAKEEYENLVSRIKKHMDEMPYADSKGRIYKYGEFFPPELSPFAYNETIAQEYYPLIKEEALAQGYRWKDPEPRQYTITMTNDRIPDNIKDADDSILKEIIQCAHNQTCNEQCTTAFKLIPDELQFYRRMNLPIPRLCPNCRHYQRLKQRNPLHLWHRKCMCQEATSDMGQETRNVYQNTAAHFHKDSPCPNEFETSYAPERSEVVYCEQCYQAEVA